MTMKRIGVTTKGLPAVVGLLLALTAVPAFCSDWNFSFGFFRPFRTAVAVEAGRYHDRQWAAGHYETRYDRVLVRAEHYERRYIAPVYATRYDRFGCAFTVCVTPGYWSEFCVPAVYETRPVQYFVPGYYTSYAPDSCRY